MVFLVPSMMRDAGIVAPCTSQTKVFLNDTYWRMYIPVLQVDDRFLKNWFDNYDGNPCKCINNTNFDQQDPSPAAYQDEFELKTNEELNNWEDFIDNINGEDNFEDNISTQLQMNN